MTDKTKGESPESKSPESKSPESKSPESQPETVMTADEVEALVQKTAAKFTAFQDAVTRRLGIAEEHLGGLTAIREALPGTFFSSLVLCLSGPIFFFSAIAFLISSSSSSSSPFTDSPFLAQFFNFFFLLPLFSLLILIFTFFAKASLRQTSQKVNKAIDAQEDFSSHWLRDLNAVTAKMTNIKASEQSLEDMAESDNGNLLGVFRSDRNCPDLRLSVPASNLKGPLLKKLMTDCHTLAEAITAHLKELQHPSLDPPIPLTLKELQKANDARY